MKRIMSTIIGIAGIGVVVVAVLLNLLHSGKVAKSFSVIGGADGPTAIFVAGKIEDFIAVGGVIIGIVLLIIACFLHFRKK